MKKITILGSTGSIGTQTLEIINEKPDAFQVIGLSAGKNISLLKEQLKKFKPEYVCINNPKDVSALKDFANQHKLKTTILSETTGLLELASIPCDLSIIAIVGTAALHPTVEAIKAQNHIALASKEVLVAAGTVIMPLIKKQFLIFV